MIHFAFLTNYQGELLAHKDRVKTPIRSHAPEAPDAISNPARKIYIRSEIFYTPLHNDCRSAVITYSRADP